MNSGFLGCLTHQDKSRQGVAMAAKMSVISTVVGGDLSEFVFGGARVGQMDGHGLQKTTTKHVDRDAQSEHGQAPQ